MYINLLVAVASDACQLLREKVTAPVTGWACGVHCRHHQDPGMTMLVEAAAAVVQRSVCAAPMPMRSVQLVAPDSDLLPWSSLCAACGKVVL